MLSNLLTMPAPKIIIILMMGFQNQFESLYRSSLHCEPFLKKNNLAAFRLNNKSAKQIYKKTCAHLRAYGIGNVLLHIMHTNLVQET